MANMKILYKNVWDSATLTHSQGSSPTLLPITNTQIYNNSRVFKSDDTTDQTILFDWANPVFMEGFVLWRHNLSSTAQIRLELFQEASQGGIAIYDSGWVNALDALTLGEIAFGKDSLGVTVFEEWDTLSSSLWFTETYTVLSGRLQISDPTNQDTYIELGRVYAGDSFSPSVNFDLNSVFQWETDSISHPTAGVSIHTLESSSYRTLTLNMSHLQPTERAEFSDMTRLVTTHRDIFVALLPGTGGAMERDHSFAAKFREIPSLTRGPLDYQAPISIREA